jgi:hypothetical protein
VEGRGQERGEEREERGGVVRGEAGERGRRERRGEEW